MNINMMHFSIAITAFIISFYSLANEGIYAISESECKIMQDSNVITTNNPVPCVRLSKVVFPFIDFNNTIQEGELVVFDAVAENTYAIFKEIFSRKIPLNKAVTIEKYNGDDNASMNDNNTSAFNGRAITSGKEWSKHAYGVAIDINPLQNPFIEINDKNGHVVIKPLASTKMYVNRNDLRPGRPLRKGMAEEMIDIFYHHGFLIWGGEWDYPIDYQHFEIGSRKFINELINMPKSKASMIFNQYVNAYRTCLIENINLDPIIARNTCVVKVKR